MPGITRFEDIEGWQLAAELTREIYRLAATTSLGRDFGLRDQLQRASVSVMANIAEGFDCESHAEFARFLGIARRSAAEVQSLLYVARDAGYITRETFQTLYDLAARTKGKITAFKAKL